jgi:rubrerythrin
MDRVTSLKSTTVYRCGACETQIVTTAIEPVCPTCGEVEDWIAAPLEQIHARGFDLTHSSINIQRRTT